MKYQYLIYSFLVVVLLGNTPVQVQVPCLTCPDTSRQAIAAGVQAVTDSMRDTLYKQLEERRAQLDTLLSTLNAIQDVHTSYTEYILLLNGWWKYEWCYLNGNYTHVIKTKL